MFWSAVVNWAVFCSRSRSRAMSSANIELSKNSVYTNLDVVAVTGRASSVP